MRRLALVLAVILPIVLVVTSSPPAGASVSIGISARFGGSRTAYGDGARRERFGTVWAQRHVDHSWRRYALSRWAYPSDDERDTRTTARALADQRPKD